MIHIVARTRVHVDTTLQQSTDTGHVTGQMMDAWECRIEWALRCASLNLTTSCCHALLIGPRCGWYDNAAGLYAALGAAVSLWLAGLVLLSSLLTSTVGNVANSVFAHGEAGGCASLL